MRTYMNTIDTIKALITYLTAAGVVLGGGAAIAFVNMPPDKLAIVAGLVGAASAFLYGQETATRTARQVIAAGQSNGVQRETLQHA